MADDRATQTGLFNDNLLNSERDIGPRDMGITVYVVYADPPLLTLPASSATSIFKYSHQLNILSSGPGRVVLTAMRETHFSSDIAPSVYRQLSLTSKPEERATTTWAKQDADTILRTADDLDFYVYKSCKLIFKHDDDDDHKDGLPLVRLPESSVTLSSHHPTPRRRTLRRATGGTTVAADKYEPLRMFGVAYYPGSQMLLQTAARTLSARAARRPRLVHRVALRRVPLGADEDGFAEVFLPVLLTQGSTSRRGKRRRQRASAWTCGASLGIRGCRGLDRRRWSGKAINERPIGWVWGDGKEEPQICMVPLKMVSSKCSSMGSNETSSTPFGPPFDDTDADTILRSSDQVDFYVYRIILSKSSPFFKSMFSLPQPDTSVPEKPDPNPVINLTENSRTVAILLAFIYPVVFVATESTEPISLDDMMGAFVAATKYDTVAVSQRLSQRFAMSTFVQDSPVETFCVAYSHELGEAARVAAKESLKHRMSLDTIGDKLQYTNGPGLHQLWKFYRACSATAAEAVSGMHLTWITSSDSSWWDFADTGCLRSSGCRDSNVWRTTAAWNDYITRAHNVLLEYPCKEALANYSVLKPSYEDNESTCFTCRVYSLLGRRGRKTCLE
ncbi:hypothetical protein EDB92DRAFT_2100504, partial [Lactarius akahatsu]